MMKKRFIWFKGEIVPVSEAKINVLSPTSQYGINVFEGIRCYWNEKDNQLYSFRLDDHLKRLISSAKLLRFKLKYDFDFLKNCFIDTVIANNFKEDIIVRQTLFIDGDGSWASTEPVEMFISPISKKRYFPKKNGISCCVSTWVRIDDNSMPPRIKSGANYLNSRFAQLEANVNGYDSSLFLNKDGKVAEGPGACIFIVRDNTLITPPITSSILESITRDTIIKLAKYELNIPVIERNIDRTELYISDEIFFAGTALEITPVISVDNFEINNGIVGNITKKLRDVYFSVARGKFKYKNWLTPIY